MKKRKARKAILQDKGLEEVVDLEKCVVLEEDGVFAEDAARHRSELLFKALNRNINS